MKMLEVFGLVVDTDVPYAAGFHTQLWLLTPANADSGRQREQLK